MRKQKQFIVRKYVMASSIVDAIRKEKGRPIEDIFVDEKWLPVPEPIEGFKK